MNCQSDYANEVSRILQAVNRGSPGAEARLVELVYEELKRIAAGRVKGNSLDQSMTPTALVNEAWMKLFCHQKPSDWSGRGHFFSAAARAMRQILIDHSRAKKSRKRGGDRLAIDLDVSGLPNLRKASSEELLDLDEALKNLENEDSQLVQLVELKFFGGHTTKQAAEIMDISPRTANRQWQYAKARLWQLLKDE